MSPGSGGQRKTGAQTATVRTASGQGIATRRRPASAWIARVTCGCCMACVRAPSIVAPSGRVTPSRTCAAARRRHDPPAASLCGVVDAGNLKHLRGLGEALPAEDSERCAYAGTSHPALARAAQSLVSVLTSQPLTPPRRSQRQPAVFAAFSTPIGGPHSPETTRRATAWRGSSPPVSAIDSERRERPGGPACDHLHSERPLDRLLEAARLAADGRCHPA